MTVLTLTPIPLHLFSHGAGTSTLVTEASDLGRGFSAQPLYDDACDVGIAICDDRGNVTTWFEALEPEVDAEGDVQAWTYSPTTETLREFPRLTGWRVVILND